MARNKFGAARRYAEKQIEKRIQGFVANLFYDIIISTPIKTGNLASNWNFNKNGYTAAYFHSPSYARLDHAQSIFNKVYATKIGGHYILSNETKYGYKIEFERRSSQAPLGMMNINVKKHVAKFKAGG